MKLRDAIRKSFQPEVFVRVGRMNDGKPVGELLKQVYKAIDSSYNTLLDNEAGVIYLKKKKKGGGVK